jgi:hypothetical protein
MQWIVDHWFEIVTTALLAVIAINTLDRKNGIIPRSSSSSTT